jgi:16S rRNA (cytosine967-C5)-methyltransferase
MTISVATSSRKRKPSSRVSPARAAAHRAVLRVTATDAYLDLVIRRLEEELRPQDRGLARRLAFGAVSQQVALDYLITRVCRRSLTKLDLPVLVSLRLGLYELLYLDGAPPHAVIHDQVELAARRLGPNEARARAAAGLVNAVLRQVAREGRRVLDLLEGDRPATVGLRYGYPGWLAKLWFQLLGSAEGELLLAAGNRPPAPWLRVNTLLAMPRQVVRQIPGSRVDRLLPEAIQLEKGVALSRLRVAREGGVVAQSWGAILAGRLLDPRPGERILDLCAAPGLKTTHIAALMAGEGKVVAVELHPKRAAALRSLAQRLGADQVEVVCGDARTVAPQLGQFDRVLVDAPCSGLGTVQRHPELKGRITPTRIRELVKLQTELLAAAAAALRPGGVLLYVTCTLSPAENEGVVSELLRGRSDLEPLDLAAVLPTFSLARRYRHRYRDPLLAAVAERSLVVLPSRHPSPGFFYAALRREGEPVPFAPLPHAHGGG